MGSRWTQNPRSGWINVCQCSIKRKCAALNNLDVWAADIQNAYLQASLSQKHYIVCGAEFGLENV
eukprot:6058518-Ditylum_brightwellii.AAC.1